MNFVIKLIFSLQYLKQYKKHSKFLLSFKSKTLNVTYNHTTCAFVVYHTMHSLCIRHKNIFFDDWTSRLFSFFFAILSRVAKMRNERNTEKERKCERIKIESNICRLTQIYIWCSIYFQSRCALIRRRCCFSVCSRIFLIHFVMI